MPTTFSNTSNLNSLGWFVIIMQIAILIVAVVAFFVAIVSFTDIAKGKGHRKTGIIWFLGIFATPIVAGIYTMQLRDLRKEKYEREAYARMEQLFSQHMTAIEAKLDYLQVANQNLLQPQASSNRQNQSQYYPQQQPSSAE